MNISSFFFCFPGKETIFLPFGSGNLSCHVNHSVDDFTM